ncbi:MBL fold metallo-hydrolase [Nocardioides sp. TF02-7]|uniref:MBL fold metallo-hydrolase n=1 Tax=Nocardioides sp. TF02-7 TaxID=2917724 RepID=UPI001F06D8B8|nr:MBL fold metallo-hydrolase [Nocardioides sp. TF02-7]UMG92537.1 MBL fold metallo-hydrolase [Nocardioides sp. TF02-7]
MTASASLEFVGTATTILRLGPFTLLTDPNFLHRGQLVYLGKGLFSRRLTEPSLQPAQLPSLDAVVLSHLHGDHFDRVARQQLDRSLPVLTTPAAARKLDRWGFGAAEGLRTWESRVLERDGWQLQVTSAPGVHGPGPMRHVMPPVMGTVLELREAGAVRHRTYISGDTLFRPWLREVTERHGHLDAAVLHLGGTRAFGILVTMDAEQGAGLTELLAADATVPIHHDDYGVFRSPVADFEAECVRRGIGSVRRVERGERVSLTDQPTEMPTDDPTGGAT